MGALGCLCCLNTGGDVRRALLVAKWAYCGLFTVVVVVTWLLRSYGEAAFTKHNLFAVYCAAPAPPQGGLSIGPTAFCSGQQVVLRFSFATFGFFAAHAGLLACCKRETDARLGLHTGLWALKALLWAAALVGSLFLPGAAVFYYGNIARGGAGLFLVFVMVEMVSWAYDANEALLARDAWWSWALLAAGAAVCFAAGVGAAAAGYIFYAAHAGCSLNLFLITWSLVAGGAMVAVLFVPRRLPVAGLLTGGIVYAYTSYLLLSALSSQPPNDCVRATGHAAQWITVGGLAGGRRDSSRSASSSTRAQPCSSSSSLASRVHALARCMHSVSATRRAASGRRAVTRAPAAGCRAQVVGFFLGVGAVCYSTLTLGTSHIFGGGDEDKGELPYRPDVFHAIFALAAMYMAMLLTNWQLSTDAADMWAMDKGWASMWVKLGSKWFCEALYLWTVVAPAVCRHREFVL